MSLEEPPKITNDPETTPGVGPRTEEERLALAKAIRAALENGEDTKNSPQE